MPGAAGKGPPMTTLIILFLIAFTASLVLTPTATLIAARFDIADLAGEQGIPAGPGPRPGGAALFFAFFIPFLVLAYAEKRFSYLVVNDERLIAFFAGGMIIFFMGLLDDMGRLPASVRIAGHALAGAVMSAGGVAIHSVSLPQAGTLDLGYLSLPATVLWFVLVINAVRRIDGPNGLAAGLGLFVSMVLLVLCLMDGRIVEALGLAALAGSLLGFLRYSFNPASGCMGRSGSCFVGFALAALVILSS